MHFTNIEPLPSCRRRRFQNCFQKKPINSDVDTDVQFPRAQRQTNTTTSMPKLACKKEQPPKPLVSSTGRWNLAKERAWKAHNTSWMQRWTTSPCWYFFRGQRGLWRRNDWARKLRNRRWGELVELILFVTFSSGWFWWFCFLSADFKMSL